MKKLAAANPSLSYADRKSLLEEFVPSDLSADNEVAAFIEKSGDQIEAFVQQIKDAWVAETIMGWAGTNQDGVMGGFRKILDTLSPQERSALLTQLSAGGSAE